MKVDDDVAGLAGFTTNSGGGLWCASQRLSRHSLGPSTTGSVAFHSATSDPEEDAHWGISQRAEDHEKESITSLNIPMIESEEELDSNGQPMGISSLSPQRRCIDARMLNASEEGSSNIRTSTSGEQRVSILKGVLDNINEVYEKNGALREQKKEKEKEKKPSKKQRNGASKDSNVEEGNSSTTDENGFKMLKEATTGALKGVLNTINEVYEKNASKDMWRGSTNLIHGDQMVNILLLLLLFLFLFLFLSELSPLTCAVHLDKAGDEDPFSGLKACCGGRRMPYHIKQCSKILIEWQERSHPRQISKDLFHIYTTKNVCRYMKEERKITNRIIIEIGMTSCANSLFSTHNHKKRYIFFYSLFFFAFFVFCFIEEPQFSGSTNKKRARKLSVMTTQLQLREMNSTHTHTHTHTDVSVETRRKRSSTSFSALLLPSILSLHRSKDNSISGLESSEGVLVVECRTHITKVHTKLKAELSLSVTGALSLLANITIYTRNIAPPPSFEPTATLGLPAVDATDAADAAITVVSGYYVCVCLIHSASFLIELKQLILLRVLLLCQQETSNGDFNEQRTKEKVWDTVIVFHIYIGPRGWVAWESAEARRVRAWGRGRTNLIVIYGIVYNNVRGPNNVLGTLKLPPTTTQKETTMGCLASSVKLPGGENQNRKKQLYQRNRVLRGSTRCNNGRHIWWIGYGGFFFDSKNFYRTDEPAFFPPECEPKSQSKYASRRAESEGKTCAKKKKKKESHAMKHKLSSPRLVASFATSRQLINIPFPLSLFLPLPFLAAVHIPIKLLAYTEAGGKIPVSPSLPRENAPGCFLRKLHQHAVMLVILPAVPCLPAGRLTRRVRLPGGWSDTHVRVSFAVGLRVVPRKTALWRRGCYRSLGCPGGALGRMFRNPPVDLRSEFAEVNRGFGQVAQGLDFFHERMDAQDEAVKEIAEAQSFAVEELGALGAWVADLAEKVDRLSSHENRVVVNVTGHEARAKDEATFSNPRLDKQRLQQRRQMSRHR
eukprot:gene7822-5455_t